MQKFSTPFKVGLVIVIGIIMAIAMLIRFSANWGQDDGVVTLHAYFDDATGLAVKSKVQVAGIQVGEVTNITLEGTRALVYFNVRQTTPIYEGIADSSGGDGYMKNGATVAKKLTGILGDYHLELTPGLAGRTLNDGDELKNVIQAAGATALLNDVGKIMKDISNVTETLSAVFGGPDGERDFKEMVQNLRDTTEGLKQITNENNAQIARIISNVDRLMEDAAGIAATGNSELPKMTQDVSALIDDLRTTVASLKSSVGSTLDTTRDGVESLKDSIDKLDRTMASIERLASNVEQGNGTVGKLLTDDSIATQAESLLAETRELIQSGTKTVDTANSLISPLSDLSIDLALRGDYLVNANAFKIDFGVKLQSKPEKYYLLNLISDPLGYSTTTRTLTDSSTSGPVYETVTTNENKLKFSVQYAMRWRWFVGRFGIIENTGGIGGDILLFDDDLQTKFDVFAFNDNKYPRIRGTMLMYLSLFLPWDWANTFYLSAGFDDPINVNVFDYFFGLGFHFTDNDIKSIMAIVPKP